MLNVSIYKTENICFNNHYNMYEAMRYSFVTRNVLIPETEEEIISWALEKELITQRQAEVAEAIFTCGGTIIIGIGERLYPLYTFMLND